MPLCTVAGCARTARTRAMCSKHYLQWRRTGQPLRLIRVAGSGTIREFGHIAHKRNGRIVFEHIEIAERALGHPLPYGAQVHHVDGNPANNAHNNLVICPSQAYHKLLHTRERAAAACGNPDWRRCTFCKRYDNPASMYAGKGFHVHRECRNKYNRERYKLLTPPSP